jgi:hypothetical protein
MAPGADGAPVLYADASTPRYTWGSHYGAISIWGPTSKDAIASSGAYQRADVIEFLTTANDGAPGVNENVKDNTPATGNPFAGRY